MSFARAANGEANATGEEHEHEPVEREDRPRHPREAASEEEGTNDEEGTDGSRERESDEVPGPHVSPGSAVDPKAFQRDDPEEHDEGKRLREPVELTGGDVKIKPQGERDQIGSGCENEVGGYYNRATVARGGR